MLRHFCFTVVLLLVLNVNAQRPAFQKMSGLVREACLSASQSQSSARAKSMKLTSSELIAFVKLTSDDSDALSENGCSMLARYGNLSVAAIPLDRIAPLSLDPRVLKIEANRRKTTLMDTTSVLLHLPEVYQGLNLPQSYTGKGVVVGVQDIGFDLTHPTFYSADMSRYRIKALWDQLSLDTLNSSLPVGRDYTDEASLLALAHTRDGLIQTHGTHTAGTAAGSGAEDNGVITPYNGVAYDSDICLVCNVTGDDATLLDPKDYYKYTFALDALGFKYIFDYAQSVGKPCVINFSEGSQEDFAGNDQLYYEMLDSLVGPGRIIVAAAGNDGQKINYVPKPSGQASAGVFCGSVQKTAFFTTKADGDFTLRFTWYKDQQPQVREYRMSDILQIADSTLRDTVVIDTLRFAIMASAYPSSYNSAEMVCDWSIATNAETMDKSLPLSLIMLNAQPHVELFPVSGYFYHNALDASLNDGDHSRSIHSPSSAPKVISVGATAYRTTFVNYLGERKVYDNGTNGIRAPFSGVGPTFDGRVKPDVMAPGQNIISAYSSYYLEHQPTARDISSDIRHFEHNGRTYAWNSNGGTSMSSPVVAGIIALWLEANPKLTMDDCLEVFSKTCRHYDTSLSYPNNLYGYGEIDACEGLKLVLEMVKNGVSVLDQPQKDNSRIYRLDGQYVGNDLDRLAPGIYVRGGKKLIKH